MRLDEYARYDAVGLMQLLRSGQVGADELKRCATAAIERLNPQLNFMAGEVCEDEACQPGGPFYGLPFLLKEGLGWRGGAAAMGSRLANGIKVTTESEITRRLRRAGVRILGETAAPELGIYPVTESGRHGATRNPWNLAHSPGGSSGGASAAVAAGVVPVAQSSDGGGSIRGPAHCTGLFGLKPSRGRTPLLQRGLFSFSHVHVSSRTVRDSAAFLDVLHGPAPGGALIAPPERPYIEQLERPLPPLRIGVLRQSPGRTPPAAECLRAVDRAARLAESQGHRVEEAQPRLAWDRWLGHFLAAWIHPLPYAIRQLGAASSRQPDSDTLDAMTLQLLRLARQLTVDDLIAAKAEFQAARIAVDTFFQDYDLWLTPAGISQAPELGRFDPCRGGEDAQDYIARALHDYAIFTPLLNITGHPAASVPLHHGDNGLPAGVQLVGPMGREDMVLRFAAQLEAADPWIGRRPPYSIFGAAHE